MRQLYQLEQRDMWKRWKKRTGGKRTEEKYIVEGVNEYKTTRDRGLRN